MEITSVFETYSTQVNQTTVTGDPDVIHHLANIVRAGDETFCIRTSDGMFCRCREYGLLPN